MGDWLRRVILAMLAVDFVAEDVELDEEDVNTVDGSPEGMCLHCAIDPTDSVAVHVQADRGLILLTALTDHRPLSTVAVVPKYARVFAAAILNAADELDGVTPLSFVPEGPDAEEPTR